MSDRTIASLLKFALVAWWWWGIMSVVDSDFSALPGAEYVFAAALGSMCYAAVTVFLNDT